jgi:murein DD-endopeptidase MepM/ murein hydrolase activator NlpD
VTTDPHLPAGENWSRRQLLALGAIAVSTPLLSFGVPGTASAAPLGESAESERALIRYQLPFPNPDLGDGFGSRMPPRTSPHRGVDFSQRMDTPIPAIATGMIVLKAGGPGHALGYYTVIHHADGKYSGYCHSNQPSWRSVGDRVQRGETFARVGNLGFSTGPHLHLTLGDDRNGAESGHVQDPIPYIIDRLNVDDGIPPEEDDVKSLILIQVPVDPITGNPGPHWFVQNLADKTFYWVQSDVQRNFITALGVPVFTNQAPQVLAGFKQI